jgi:hypothetical protein
VISCRLRQGVGGTGRPERQEGVSRKLDHIAAIENDSVHQRSEVGVQDGGDGLRPGGALFRQALGQRREAGDVGEQHRSLQVTLVGSFGLVWKSRHPVDNQLRQEGGEGLGQSVHETSRIFCSYSAVVFSNPVVTISSSSNSSSMRALARASEMESALIFSPAPSCAAAMSA